MTTYDFLNRFDHVKQCGANEWSARCPAHDDRVNSLSISEGADGKILLHCHAGCDTESILSEAGLKYCDLYPENSSSADAVPVREAEYPYYDHEGRPILKKIRLRRPDGGKSFYWQRLEGDVWVNGRGDISPPLYGTYSVHEGSEIIFVAEGEKDCDSVTSIFGFPCVSLPDGAKRNSIRWKDEYSDHFRGRSVYILQDNDDVGKAFAKLEARQIKPLADAVYVLDLSNTWPDIPPKGDISDMIDALGPEEAARRFTALCEAAEPWNEAATVRENRYSCFKTLDRIPEEEPRWFIEGWLPEGQICILASDGGVGKTSLAVDIAAKRSAGMPCILDDPDLKPEPQLIAYISTEDSVRMKLRRKIREAGADMTNILTPDYADDKADRLRAFKFGSEYLKGFIREFRPALCILDPIQGFIPPNINMGSRNAMRDCLDPLINLGEETGTTFLIICHSNKRKGASGRDRLADSADIWDIARSVLMMGFTPEQGKRYLSHEKSNYGITQKTRLFTMDSMGRLVADGTTHKKDKDFQKENEDSNSPGKKEDCKAWILQSLKENRDFMFLSDMTEDAEMEGFTKRTFDRARYELKKDCLIDVKQKGFAGSKKWYVVPLEIPKEWNPSET